MGPTSATNTTGDILGLIGQVQMPAKLKISATTGGGVKITGSTPTFQADFGQLLQGQTPSATFTITNIGEIATAGAVGLTLTNTAATSVYAALGTSTCGTTALAPGGTCTVVVNSQLGAVIGAQSGLSVKATDASAASETST